MGAFQRGGRGSESHGIAHLKAGADCKDIGAVEDVAGARRVDDGNRIGGAALQVAVLVPTHPVAAARDGHDTAIEPRELVQRCIVRRSGKGRECRLREDGVIGDRQQAFEPLCIGDVAIEYGRNTEPSRLAEQRDGAFDPARIGQHRRRLRDFIQRQPISDFRKCPAKIHDLALAGAVDDDPRDRGTPIPEQSEIGDVDSFGAERRAHFAPCGIISGAAPEGDRAAEPRTGHGGVRRHSTAERRIIPAPDLLALSRKKSVDAPDLIERGEPKTDDADLPGLRRHIRGRLVRGHCSTPPSVLSNRWVFPDCGRRLRRSPTFGRSDGSTRAIAEAPARSKWISVSEPSGSPSLTITATPSAGSAATAKCSGRIPSTPLPAWRSGAQLSPAGGTAAPLWENTTPSPRHSTGKKFIAGEPMKPATNWLAGRS